MASPSERAFCVMWFFESKSVTQVQRNFRTKYGKHPPSRNSIIAWKNKFLETGSVLDRHRSGRRSTSESDVDRIHQSFARSPRKSVRTASMELRIPRSTVHDVLHKKLRLRAYKVQITQELQVNDLPRRYAFALEMLSKMEDDDNFLKKIIFTDESTFHVSGVVNRHNVRIWGSENPHVVMEIERDSPKINVWCGLMRDRVIGPFFFHEKTITKEVYLDMLQIYAVPQISHLQPNILWQQDGAPPHWGKIVREFLNLEFPNRWIGRDGPIQWPPRSPDITPLDFFLWGFVKDTVYSTKVHNISDLKHRITAAISQVTESMLQRTWSEIDYRMDILRATKGAHIEVY